MFFNNSNFPLQNDTNKLFVFDEAHESKKRKSISFCAKDDPLREMNLFQNALGNEFTAGKNNPDPKSKI